MGNEIVIPSLYSDKPDPKAASKDKDDHKEKEQKELPPVRTYTKHEVQQHNDKDKDFWIIVNTGSYYGVYDITEMSRDPSLHPVRLRTDWGKEANERLAQKKFNLGLNEANKNNQYGNDVSQLMGYGAPQSHSWSKWPNAQDRKKFNIIFMGTCSDP